MSRKHSLEEVKEIYEKSGYELISEYKDVDTVLFVKDKEGYVCSGTLKHFKENHFPSKFQPNNPYTIQNIKLWIKNNNIEGYELLSEKYNNCDEDLLFRCVCSHEFKMSWDLFKRGTRCPYCCNRKVLQGYNDIYTTDRWMCDLGVSEEDAKTHTKCSGKKVRVICPNCKKEKEMIISSIYKKKSISCTCGDGVSYPEKFIMSFLNQLNIKYKTQLSKKDFSWIGSKRYDFYFEYNNKKYIIETHGMQHYDDKFYTKKEEEQKNDLYKKELALNNGIDCYIELDCRKSNIDWIKNSIIHSELNNIFNLNNIDWNLCDSNGYKNIVRQSCEMFNNGKNTDEIAQILKVSKTTICNYLNIGTSLNWCVYDGREEHKRRLKEKNDNKIKPIKVYNYHTGEFIGIYKSVKDCVEQFKNKFGIKLSDGTIYGVLNGTYKKNKGYTFKHATKEEYLNYINKTE